MNTNKIYQAAFADELEKIALSTDAVEDRLGTVFTDEQIDVAQALLDAAKAKSFSLRHPWITGIPSLGIVPAISTAIAHDDATKTMARKYPDLKELYQKKIDQDAVERAAAASASTVKIYNNKE